MEAFLNHSAPRIPRHFSFENLYRLLRCVVCVAAGLRDSDLSALQHHGARDNEDSIAGSAGYRCVFLRKLVGSSSMHGRILFGDAGWTTAGFTRPDKQRAAPLSLPAI